MLQIAIADDEKKPRRALRDILEPWLELQAVPCQLWEYESGEKLCEGYRKYHFDLIFLDIEMEGMNGMETARQLRSIDQHGILIFVTAYPDYVFQGYEVRAFHYILKPYQEKRLLDITARALEEIQQGDNDFYLLPQGAGSCRLNLRDTLYFRSEGRYITAFACSGEKSFRGKLNDLESQLPGYFVRIHQRYLVNIRQVSRTGDSFAVIGSEKLPVSRSHKQAFLIAFAGAMLDVL